jgi:hypothetical protein
MFVKCTQAEACATGARLSRVSVVVLNFQKKNTDGNVGSNEEAGWSQTRPYEFVMSVTEIRPQAEACSSEVCTELFF